MRLGIDAFVIEKVPQRFGHSAMRWSASVALAQIFNVLDDLLAEAKIGQ
jgi:hypothetical protein